MLDPSLLAGGLLCFYLFYFIKEKSSFNACEINRNITGEARFFLYEIKQVKTQKNACYQASWIHIPVCQTEKNCSSKIKTLKALEKSSTYENSIGKILRPRQAWLLAFFSGVVIDNSMTAISMTNASIG